MRPIETIPARCASIFNFRTLRVRPWRQSFHSLGNMLLRCPTTYIHIGMLKPLTCHSLVGIMSAPTTNNPGIGRLSRFRPQTHLPSLQELTLVTPFGIVTTIAFRGMEHEGTTKNTHIDHGSLSNTGCSGICIVIFPLLHNPCPATAFALRGQGIMSESRNFG